MRDAKLQFTPAMVINIIDFAFDLTVDINDTSGGLNQSGAGICKGKSGRPVEKFGFVIFFQFIDMIT
jgi:hypothetical protein